MSSTENEGDENPKEKDKEKERDQSASAPQGSKSAPAGSKNVRRLLNFDELECNNQMETLECARLLKAMELEEEDGLGEECDDNFETSLQEDEEAYQLPKVWVLI